MDRKKDAYGQEILSYLKKRQSYEIIQRDDGYFGPSSGPKSYFAEYEDWPNNQKDAIGYAKGRVLDIGIGAGRHSLYLQKKGLDVTGIDNSPLTIQVAKKRKVKKAKVLSINHIDQLKGCFDTILMLGNNFGLFGSYTKAKRLLKKLYRITSKKALIIAESTDPYKTKEKVHLDYHKLNRKRGRMSGQLRLKVRFERYVSDWFDYLIVSKKEMKDILEYTGWKIKKIINNKKSASYIAIIQKT